MRKFSKTILSLAIITLIFARYSYALSAESASLVISKNESTVSVGERITLDVKVASNNQPINAVSGTIVFPKDLLKVASVSIDRTIVNAWIPEGPFASGGKISFQGVVFDPGYRGNGGTILQIIFEAKKTGFATISFSDGTVLANDGLGTNILSSLKSTGFNIIGTGALDLIERPIAELPRALDQGRVPALPVITDYSASVLSKDSIYLKGKGEPGALTKLSFVDVSHKSFGEQFMDFIQSKKKKLSDVLVKNSDKGLFEYVTPNNLVAGVYNATPYLVDDNTDKPGLGVQLFVSDSKIIKWLIIFINILILLIPIVGLIMIVYFIPWYSSRRMRILKRKMGLEEEKIELTKHELERRDRALDEDTVPTPPAPKN